MIKKLLIAGLFIVSSSAFATVSTINFGTITDPDPASSFNTGTFAYLDISSTSTFDLSGAFTTSKNLTNVALYDGTTNAAIATSGSKDSGYSFSLTNLLAGNYQLRFNVASGGTITGSYTLSTITTPVPEPESYGMILFGLTLIGAITHRRQKRG